MTTREKELTIGLGQAYQALRLLAAHPAFENDAPEFNEGGIGYEACQACRTALWPLATKLED